MADLADVMDALASAATAVVYPLGPSAPSAIGVPVQVAQGWPLQQTLEAIAAKAGQAPTNPVTLVSVYAVPGSTGDGGTVMNFSAAVVSTITPGIAVSASDVTATFSGTAVGGEVATLIVNGAKAYSFACQAGDTDEIVAGALAQAAAADFQQAAWVPGTGSLQVPGSFSLVARIGASGTLGRKTHRQKTQIRIVVWSSNPGDRTTVARAIDAAIKSQVSFAMPDTSAAIITYQGTNLDDGMERAGLFRRDLIYTALYDTIEEFPGVEITAVGLEMAPPGAVIVSASS